MRRLGWIVVGLLVAAMLVVLYLRGDRIRPAGNGRTRLRVVSLAPSVTEMLFALGAEDSIVGVTDRCDYPPAARRIRSIGGFGTPNVETLLALAPDLAIATGLERPDATEALRRAGIRIVWIKTGSFDELFQSLRQIGRETGTAQRAEELVAGMQSELDAITQRCREIPADRRPRVFVEVWNDPLTTVGAGSFVDELIARAGGINVAHDLDDAYPVVNPEKVIAWNPDVIVLGYMNQQAVKETIADRIGWKAVEAVRTGRIVSDISSDILLRPGPRLVRGVRALHRAFYGHVTADRGTEP